MKLIAPYQVEGVEWLLKRENLTLKFPGGLLCDEMGLGKTIQMISVLLQNPKPHTLIVVPKSIVNQWNSELKKFAPSLNVCVYDGPKRVFTSESDVCICPYSVLIDLVDHPWNRIILDEGHEIRSPKSLIHKTCMSLKGDIKWILTGTPVFNKMRDFVSLCEFIGVSKKFVQAYFEEVRNEYVLRRTKKQTVECDFVNVELEMYDEERELYERVYDMVKRGEYEILEGLLRLRQISTCPRLYDASWSYPSAKIDSLICMIRSHPNEKTLVFTQFIGEAREIQRRLTIPVFSLDGRTKDRESIIHGFKESSAPAVFIIQIKAGGVGLNLQEATRVYITHPSWNPATELQAIARAYRTGQTQKVYVKKLIYVGVDEVEHEIVNLQIKKSKLCSHVLSDVSLESQIPEIKHIESNFEIKLGYNLGINDETSKRYVSRKKYGHDSKSHETK